MDSIMNTITVRYNSNALKDLRMDELYASKTKVEIENSTNTDKMNKLEKISIPTNQETTIKHDGFGRTRAEFKYHEEVNRISIKVIDESTNEVIREIPPEKSIEVLKQLIEIPGLFVDEKR